MMKSSSPQHLTLTLPIWGNYGGNLQAYALWKCVAALHPDAKLAEFPYRQTEGTLLRITKNILRYGKIKVDLLLRWFGLAAVAHAMTRYLQRSYTIRFKRLLETQRFPRPSAVLRATLHSSAWVVGSDQVWRAMYGKIITSNPSFFFLDFLPESARRRSISYAASFGTDEWEGTPEETATCKKLLQQFKAVSVREISGIRICREVFGVEAVQMPDPTLLLRKEEYLDIIKSEQTYQHHRPYIAAYVLDNSPRSLSMLQAVSEKLGLPEQQLLPHAKAKLRRDRFPISVPQWLRYMQEAELIVTDSFHGCVFSIIFNKPFVCLGNERRGAARFHTLFQTFHLESRLATSPEQALEIAQTPIDWEEVNAIHDSERARGLAFLREHLS